MALNIPQGNFIAVHQLSRKTHQRLELPVRHRGLFQVTHQTDADAKQIPGPIARRYMRTPQVQRLSPIACDFTDTQAVTVANDVVVRNRIDRIPWLPLSVYTLKKLDIAKSTGTVMNDDVAPAGRPKDAAKAHGSQYEWRSTEEVATDHMKTPNRRVEWRCETANRSFANTSMNRPQYEQILYSPHFHREPTSICSMRPEGVKSIRS